jgi:signal transduction histidine kinase
VQEALTNVVKHAGPAVEAEVLLSWTRRALRLQVSDEGPARTGDDVPVGGHGLTGMRERLHLVGGRLDAGPSASGGFTVSGEIPTAAAGRQRGTTVSDTRAVSGGRR